MSVKSRRHIISFHLKQEYPPIVKSTQMRSLNFFIYCSMVAISLKVSAQSDSDKVPQKDSIATMMVDSTLTDSAKAVEDAPLDIAQNRGLFLNSENGQTQLRILGSVRYLMVFDLVALQNKNTINTYEVPTGTNFNTLPNYFNGLEQTRLGFEVTRKTDVGDIFIRLETDFAGADGYRIRHAYGQFGKFLFGQTWSLFSQVSVRPATVSTRGPTGSISQRTPQIRYSTRGPFKSDLSFGVEYSTPEIGIPDSITVETFQVIPDITARLRKRTDWGLWQISGIVPILTGRSLSGEFIMRPGWGLSLGATYEPWLRGNWFFQIAGGNAITRFFTDLRGQGLDVIVNPNDSDPALPFVSGGYIGYKHEWGDKLFSNVIVGTVQITNPSFTPPTSYHRGVSYRANTFWDILEGARMGAEVSVFSRYDKNGANGTAGRASVLFYYDF